VAGDFEWEWFRIQFKAWLFAELARLVIVGKEEEAAQDRATSESSPGSPAVSKGAKAKKEGGRLVGRQIFYEMSQAATKGLNMRKCAEGTEGLSDDAKQKMWCRMKCCRKLHEFRDGGRLGWIDGMQPGQKKGKIGSFRASAIASEEHTYNKVVAHEATIFDGIMSVHVSDQDHFGDLDHLYALCQQKFATTFTREARRVFLSFCPCCSARPHNIKRQAGISPMADFRFNRRVQMDVVDMQKCHKEVPQCHKELDGNHPEKAAWKQAHEEHGRLLKALNLTTKNQTGFSLLPRCMVTIFDHASKLRRFFAVHTKTPAVLGQLLCDYAAAHGGFEFLHTDNGSDVLNKAGHDPKEAGARMGTTAWENCREILKLRMMLPHVKAMQGAPCHSQSQGGVENPNKYGQRRLCQWMKQHKTLHWWMGLKHLNYQAFVSDVNASTKMTPHKYLFGRKPPVTTGLANTRLHNDLLDSFLAESVAVGFLMLGGPVPLLERFWEAQPERVPMGLFGDNSQGSLRALHDKHPEMFPNVAGPASLENCMGTLMEHRNDADAKLIAIALEQDREIKRLRKAVEELPRQQADGLRRSSQS
jgi:hypothetical protein